MIVDFRLPIVDLEPLSQVLSKVREKLQGVSETAYLDAQVLLAHLLNRTRSWVMAHPEVILTSEQHKQLENYLERLVSGEPLPYLLERWEFYGLEFFVTPDVLIPRPETELLVEQALDWLMRHPGPRLAVDVGTGSGCIAVALASKIPSLNILACDISLAALRVARQNVRQYHLGDRVYCVQADLISGIDGGGMYPRGIDLICANLPYVPSDVLFGLPVSRREPCLALDGGPDGLEVIRRLLLMSPGALACPGLLLIEIEASQGVAVETMAKLAFPRANVELFEDLSGRARLICVRNNS